LQIDICKHLGPEATSRPANYNGKNGFVIKALRPFTPAQLEDLKAASELYDYDRRRARDERREEPSYYDTAARRDQGRFNSEPSNSGDYYPPGPGGYPPSTNSMYTNNPGYAPSAYTTAPNYPTSYTMVSGSTIPATYGPVSGAYDPNYTTYAPQPPTGYPADYQQYAGGNYDQYAQPRNPTVGLRMILKDVRWPLMMTGTHTMVMNRPIKMLQMPMLAVTILPGRVFLNTKLQGGIPTPHEHLNRTQMLVHIVVVDGRRL